MRPKVLGVESAWQLSFPSLLNRHVTHSTVADTGVSQIESLLFQGTQTRSREAECGLKSRTTWQKSGGGVGRHTPLAYGAGTQRSKVHREGESALLSHLHTEGGTSVALQSGTCEGGRKVRKGKVYSHGSWGKQVCPAPSLLGSPPSQATSAFLQPPAARQQTHSPPTSHGQGQGGGMQVRGRWRKSCPGKRASAKRLP